MATAEFADTEAAQDLEELDVRKCSKGSWRDSVPPCVEDEVTRDRAGSRGRSGSIGAWRETIPPDVYQDEIQLRMAQGSRALGEWREAISPDVEAAPIVEDDKDKETHSKRFSRGRQDVKRNSKIETALIDVPLKSSEALK
eukprot:TRINITY_DN16665_c0_g1_i1.p1 TRINITY_DN16665_c0_g1~~TRINITY_DN16665_c0_g1_i1.p1  ORF type:complete len:141 (-),score=25.82 TRINITY_DN16665_c0_g1_i1:235-657(-)